MRYGHELLSFSAGRQRRHRDGEGPRRQDRRRSRRDYLVGCDGGGSIVRKTLGIALTGNEDRCCSCGSRCTYCDELFERIPIGKGRHYHVADNHATQLIVQDSTRHFTLHSIVDSDADMVRDVREDHRHAAASSTRSMSASGSRTCCSPSSYGEGRVFIAGDAAHLVIPTGGLGMNSGVGDAIDLSWKLAAMLEGWGGPKLLPSYTTERRQVGDLNVQASRYATLGRRKWRSMWKPNIRDDTPEGAASRAELARVADAEQRKSNEMIGAELGYHYFGSPLVAPEEGEGPDYDFVEYTPDAPGRACGCRTPGSTTARRCRTASATTAASRCCGSAGRRRTFPRWRAAFAAYRAPLRVLDVPDAAPRAVYGFDLILLRPDMHVAWRGNRPPDDPAKLAAIVTGH